MLARRLVHLTMRSLRGLKRLEADVNYTPLSATIGVPILAVSGTQPVIFNVNFHYVADARFGVVL